MGPMLDPGTLLSGVGQRPSSNILFPAWPIYGHHKHVSLFWFSENILTAGHLPSIKAAAARSMFYVGVPSCVWVWTGNTTCHWSQDDFYRHIDENRAGSQAYSHQLTFSFYHNGDMTLKVHDNISMNHTVFLCITRTCSLEEARCWNTMNTLSPFICHQCDDVYMMTSSNGNIFRVTGPLCGEFTGPGEFPAQRPVTRSFDVYFDLRPN